MIRPAAAALALAVLAPAAPTDAAPLAVRAGTLHTLAGPAFEPGVLVVDGGRIVAVGSPDDVEIPADAEVIDAGDRVVMPGLVDTHSHVGSVSGGDRSGPLHPGVRALDSIDVRSPTFVKALAGGITTVNVMPGSGHLLSGQTVYLKIRREGLRVEDWLFCEQPDTDVCGGIKMANGTNSIGQPPFPGTRAKSAALRRAELLAAREYGEKQARAEEKGEPIERDLGKEALLEVLAGERIVHFHTHRHNDVLTALRIAREFGFRPVLHHVSDAAIVADVLAEENIPVSFTGVDSPGGKEEALRIGWGAPAVLEAKGVPVAFNTDDGITDSRLFLRAAAMGVRFGMTRDGALASLTTAGAEMLGLADRVGSLEVGKDADFLVLSGDPLALRTRVLETWVEGRKVFDLADPDDRRVAVGGWNAFPADAAHLH